MCKRSVMVLATILFFLMVANFCFATNYFVDASNGNDNNPGTSPTTAWKSISKINNSLFLAGDSIFLKRK